VISNPENSSGIMLTSSTSRFMAQIYNVYHEYIAKHLGLVIFASIVVYYLSLKFDPYLYPIPGPFLAGFTSLWKTWDTFKGGSEYTSKHLLRN
jgi:hypothetical protein